MYRFLITYDLHKPGRNYNPLWEELGRLGAVRVLESVWYLKGSYTCVQVRDHFKQFVDQNDSVLAVRLDDWASWKVATRLDY